jgi:exportin-5
MSASGSVGVNGAQLLMQVLKKIFDALIFNLANEDPRSVRSAAVKNLKRHAAASIVKIALKYPLLLLSTFDQIDNHIKTLCSDASTLSGMEKLLLKEALLIISNHFCEFERQQLFVGDIIRPAVLMWQNLSPSLKSAPAFMNYVGLSSKPPIIAQMTNVDEDLFFKNRQAMQFALNSVLGVIKRCQAPDDPDKAYRGGFIVATTDSGNPITRNPAAPHVIPLLQYILALLKCLNELYSPSSISLINEAYKGANDILENEKKVMLGAIFAVPDPLDPVQLVKAKTPLDYMQQFLSNIFDNCYHLMGSAGSALGRDFYGLDGLATALINSCFSNLQHVPDFRLRTIIRVFLRHFVYSCPATYHAAVVVPIFGHIAPHSEYF